MTDSARILVVDNYDSFVYTIVGYLKTLGATVDVVRNDAIDPAALSLASMPSLDVDAVHSGMATSSSVDVCDPFMANATPTTMAITAINATTTPIMMRLRFLALAAAARCSARDLTFAALVPLVGEICSNWPVTGLNACVGC